MGSGVRGGRLSARVGGLLGSFPVAALMLLTLGVGTASAAGETNPPPGATGGVSAPEGNAPPKFTVAVPGSVIPGNRGGAAPVVYDPHAYTCVFVDPHADATGYHVATAPAGQTAAEGRSMDQFCSEAWVVNKAAGMADPMAACTNANVACGITYGVWVKNATPSPAQIAAAAFAEMGLDKPNIHTSPDAARRLVVHLPTWLWVDGKRGDQQQTTGAITITAKQSVVWSTDEGSVPCSGPGTPYVPGKSDPKAASPDCGASFTKAGSAKWIKAVVTWRGSFTVGGGAPVAIPTPITFTVTKPVAVDEVQTVNGG